MSGEAIIFVIQFIFIAANIPIFLKKQFPPVLTCAITGFGLIGIGVGSCFEALFFAAAAQIVSGIMWLIMIPAQNGKGNGRV